VNGALTPGKICNILLVEDNPGDVRLMTEAFVEANGGARLVDVDNGTKALAYLRQQTPYQKAVRPDIIILDLNLPGKHGTEVLAEIKADASLRRIPVVILSSSQSPQDVHQCYDLHANCFISKPFGYNEFQRVMRCIQEFWIATARLPEAS
jgi:two-component system, chemotaxis family, response regulator Rcp1